MRKHYPALAAIVALTGCVPQDVSRELVVEFEYAVTFNQPGLLQAWIPLPRNDPFQAVTNLRVKTSLAYELVADSLYGNQMVYIQNTLHAGVAADTSPSFTLTFTVRRKEAATYAERGSVDAFGRFLEPRAMVPLEPRFRAIADSVSPQEVELGPAVYKYILNHMSYSKSGEGWGLGDAAYACDLGQGNCTDYHSLFNAIMRTRAVPARFHIGFPIPDEKAGTIPGYHCWAEFYIEGNWIPVDISEADKRPERQTYYYGRLDERRVDFTIGRDIPLPGGQQDVANFLIYPYVKIDGALTSRYDMRFGYRESTSPAESGAI